MVGLIKKETASAQFAKWVVALKGIQTVSVEGLLFQLSARKVPLPMQV
jgi:hypothetical protein